MTPASLWWPPCSAPQRCESCNVNGTREDDSIMGDSEPSPSNDPNEVEIENPPQQKTSGASALSVTTHLAQLAFLALSASVVLAS
ncbi:hypothetical protein FHG87_004310 [Trinorchestia longiramus]|nr:hypothetical protein FHG87_004310 [Trinorchestia longiramus]